MQSGGEVGGNPPPAGSNKKVFLVTRRGPTKPEFRFGNRPPSLIFLSSSTNNSKVPDFRASRTIHSCICHLYSKSIDALLTQKGSIWHILPHSITICMFLHKIGGILNPHQSTIGHPKQNFCYGEHPRRPKKDRDPHPRSRNGLHLCFAHRPLHKLDNSNSPNYVTYVAVNTEYADENTEGSTVLTTRKGLVVTGGERPVC